MLFGEYERTVDYKGRMTLPGHLLMAGEDADWGHVMVVKGEQPCLYVFDAKTWDGLLNRAHEEMEEDDESRIFMHRRLSNAHLSDVDAMKRVTLPPSLLEYAGIEKRAIIVGMFDRLELWNPDAWQSYVDALEDVPVPSISELSRSRIRQVS